MVKFKRSDLQYNYSWTAAKENDNEQVTGFPDSYLLDRQEGYEVLPFINRYMNLKGFQQLSIFQRIETLIRVSLPGDIRGHAKIKKWLDEKF